MITANQPVKRLELFEILEQVSSSKSRKEKIETLKKNNSSALSDYLRCVFDDVIEFKLPEGKPPYNPCEEQHVPSTWHRQNTKLEFLVKNSPKAENLLNLKREIIFIGILESVHPKDAEILVDMINKKTNAKGLTKKLVQEAFPNLIVR